MKKTKNKEFIKTEKGGINLNILLVPVSIVLAGVLIMVSVLISAVSVKKEVTSLKTQITDLQKKVAAIGTGTTAAATPAPTITEDQYKALFSMDVIKFGDANKKLVFVEFSDPSCPYCHIAAGHNPELNKQVGDRFKLDTDGGSYKAPVKEIKKLVDEGKASFVWLYNNGHGNGELGTQAMYCGYEKGKFWEVHDLLMTAPGYDILNEKVQNDKSKSGELAEFLKSAMNPSEMKSCLESGKYADRIARDQQLASSFYSTGTPGYYVNTTNFAGAYSYTDMEATVNGIIGN